MEVVLSREAKHELSDIYDYLLDNFGQRVATIQTDKIYKDISMLEKDPFLGKHIVDGIRKLNSGVNIIIYEVQERFIEIHHVVNSRTDWTRTLGLDK